MWADMIAVASAQVACLRHELQLATMEFWRADIQQVLEGSNVFGRTATGAVSGVNAAQLRPTHPATNEKRRALQQWLYESHCDDVFSSDDMIYEQQRLENAALELGAVKTVGMCRRQTDKRPDCRDICGKSLLEVQWICQYALVRHHQLSLQGRQRAVEQGSDLREVRLRVPSHCSLRSGLSTDSPSVHWDQLDAFVSGHSLWQACPRTCSCVLGYKTRQKHGKAWICGLKTCGAPLLQSVDSFTGEGLRVKNP